MLHSATLLLLLAAHRVAARFSGHLVVAERTDGGCLVNWNAHDSAFPDMSCPDSACHDNGNGQIVTSRTECTHGHGGPPVGTLDVYPHDRIKFCREPAGGGARFCTCVRTKYDNIDYKGDLRFVNFDYNDDHTVPC